MKQITMDWESFQKELEQAKLDGVQLGQWECLRYLRGESDNYILTDTSWKKQIISLSKVIKLEEAA